MAELAKIKQERAEEKARQVCPVHLITTIISPHSSRNLLPRLDTLVRTGTLIPWPILLSPLHLPMTRH